MPITLLILLIAFGALVAAGVPLLLGFTAVIGALGLIKPLSHLYPVAQGEIEPVVLLVGFAVGVDYSMFYLRRKLEERRRGARQRVRAGTSRSDIGRAVLISGLTVMTAMAGMLVAGNAVFTSLAMGTMVVVAVAVIGSVTVLPGVMAKLGDSVEKGRVPVIARRRARAVRLAAGRAWSTGCCACPWSVGMLSAGVLLLARRTGAVDAHRRPGHCGLPSRSADHEHLRSIRERVPGRPMSATRGHEAPPTSLPPPSKVRSERCPAPPLPTRRDGQGRSSSSSAPTGSVAAVTISLAGNGTNDASDQALATLRTPGHPSHDRSGAGVSRPTSAGRQLPRSDFNRHDEARTFRSCSPSCSDWPSCSVLVMFRSLVIPLVTIVLNMLSVGAAYGVTVLIFQDGYLRSLIGAPDIGGVDRLDTALLVRSPVRPLDGLPRADPEPDPRGTRTGTADIEAVAEGITLYRRDHHERCRW